MAEERTRYCDRVAVEFIRRLEDGTAPWVRPWAPGEAPAKPVNALTGREYHNLNSLYLSMVQPTADPRWCTLKQANQIGGRVREGERGELVRFFKTKDRALVRDADGKALLDGDGKRQYREVELERPKYFHAVVFHASQIDGLPAYEGPAAKEREWEPVEAAQAILEGSGAVIKHDQRDRAYYQPGTDEIHLPGEGQFPTPENYYATALHELGHWTGHPERLDRQFGRHGDPEYAREELRAEIGSYMLGTELGVGHDGSSHASYVASWIKVLQKDPQEVYAATRDAERIGRYLKGLGREREKERIVEKGKSEELDPAVRRGEARRSVAARVAMLGEAFAEAAGLGVESALAGDWQKGIRPVALDDAGVGLVVDAAAAAVTRFADEKRPDPAKLRGRAAVRRVAREAAVGALDLAPGRTDLAVPRSEKDEAKALGAKWDWRGRTWYAPEGTALAPLARWAGREAEAAREVPPVAAEKTRLAVPFAENDEAKALGAKWDREGRTWYAPEGTPLDPLARWIGRAAEERVAAGERTDPVEEFGEFLKDKGLVLDGAPIMDGGRHRVAVEGGRPGATDGMYVGYLDGVPAGFVKNWKSGVEENWRSASRSLSREETAVLREEAAKNRAAREAAREEEYKRAAGRAAADYGDMREPGSEGHRYLEGKGLDDAGGLGVKLDKGDVVVPLRDGEGTIWSLQRIGGDGFKSLMPGGRAAGCFHVIGELDEKENRRAMNPHEDVALYRDDAVREGEPAPKEVLVTTGFGTGAVIHAATSQPVVCAISDHNLPAVAVAMRERFPDHDIVVLGDDDKHLERENPPKPNSGREKAERAAELTDGIAVFPKFPPHRTGRDYTDWADLARVNSSLEGAVDSPRAGRTTVRRQIVIGCERERSRRQRELGERDVGRTQAEERHAARANGRDGGPER